MKIEQEVKKAVEQLTAGDKIQLELDKKNQVLKIWKLNLKKIEVKGENMKELKKKIEEKTFDWKVEIFEEVLREAKSYYLYSKYEDDKNKIANRALCKAAEIYGLNGAAPEDSGAWEKARDLVL